MGGTSSKQVGIEKESSFSRLTSRKSESQLDVGESYLDTMLALHSNDLVLLNYNCDYYIPNIKYGIISKILTAKSFIVVCPMICESANNKHHHYKLHSFVLYLNGITVPKIESNNENETQAAIKLQEYVHDTMYNKRVYLNNIKINDDGRIFCDMQFTSTDMDVKQYFIQQNMGVSYGTIIPEDWLHYILKENIYYSKRQN